MAENNSVGNDRRMAKRTTSVTVKMTGEDYALMERAAEEIWPKAVITKSAIVLGLARIGAESVLPRRAGGKKS